MMSTNHLALIVFLVSLICAFLGSLITQFVIIPKVEKRMKRHKSQEKHTL